MTKIIFWPGIFVIYLIFLIFVIVIDPFEIKTSLNRQKGKDVMDWDEAASDTVSSVEEVHDPGRQAKDLNWLKLFFCCAFLVLAGRIFYLQIVQGKNFRALSDSNRVRSQSVLAPRGLILDANGEVLAQNSASFNLVVTPFDLPKSNPDLESEIGSAAAAFGFDSSQLLAKIKTAAQNPLTPIVAKQNLDHDTAILFETRAQEFIGFSVDQIPVRQYTDGPAFSHVLGYTGQVS